MRMRKVQRVWNRLGARMEAEGESLRPAFSCLASHAKKLLFPLSFAFKIKVWPCSTSTCCKKIHRIEDGMFIGAESRFSLGVYTLQYACIVHYIALHTFLSLLSRLAHGTSIIFMDWEPCDLSDRFFFFFLVSFEAPTLGPTSWKCDSHRWTYRFISSSHRAFN